MKYVVLVSRFLYAIIFLLTIAHHFSPNTVSLTSHARTPVANYLFPITGILAVMGAVSIVVGYKAKLGAWLIVIFLVPVTFVVHPFLQEAVLFQTEMQLAVFAKNIFLLGGALIISYFGAGRLSFDEDNKSSTATIKRIGRSQTTSSMGSGIIRERLTKYI